MVFYILGFNLIASLGCLLTAWYLWRLRRSLIAVTLATHAWQAMAQDLLSRPQVTDSILAGRALTVATRHHYRRLQSQIQRLQQLLQVVVFLASVWRQYRQPFRRHRHRLSSQVPRTRHRP